MDRQKQCKGRERKLLAAAKNGEKFQIPVNADVGLGYPYTTQEELPSSAPLHGGMV